MENMQDQARFDVRDGKMTNVGKSFPSLGRTPQSGNPVLIRKGWPFQLKNSKFENFIWNPEG